MSTTDTGGALTSSGPGGYKLPSSLNERPKLTSLDKDYHDSTHARKSMSTRHLLNTPNRHDDLLRSGSTHQLLNRPTGRFANSAVAPITPAEAIARQAAAPQVQEASEAAAAAASRLSNTGESLQGTEETAEDSDSVISEESFCDASGDCAADKEYLRKDLGASLHDDELDFDSDDDEDLIDEVENQMKIEGGPLEGEDEVMGEQT